MKGWILSLFPPGFIDGHVIYVNLLVWFIAFVDFCMLTYSYTPGIDPIW